MNQENKSFIEDFRRRTQAYASYTEAMQRINDKKCKVNNSLNELHGFLQTKVMGHSTSSLVRTNVELPMTDDYDKERAKKIITINHKGIGTIKVKKEDSPDKYYVSGTNFSEPMRPAEMIQLLATPAVRDQVKTELLKNNNFKVLRFFNDVCGAEVELDELSKISAKYSDDIKYEMNLPEPVYYADTTENDEEDKYNQVTKLSPITINYIVLDASKKIKVNHEERWNNGHNPEENKLSLEVDEITTAMFLMQIPDEIHAALTEIEANLTKDEAEADKLIQQVKDRLATYAVMDALN